MIDTIELFKIIKRMLENSSAPNVSISAIYTQYARCACAAALLDALDTAECFSDKERADVKKIIKKCTANAAAKLGFSRTWTPSED